MSIILENNTYLVELKSKNQSLESKICEYKDELTKTFNDQKQLMEKINNFENIGEFKFTYN